MFKLKRSPNRYSPYIVRFDLAQPEAASHPKGPSKGDEEACVADCIILCLEFI